MDLGLSGKRALAHGDDARIVRSCIDALTAEGAAMLAADADGTGADIIVFALARRPALDIAQLDEDARTLAGAWDSLADFCARAQHALPGMVERGFGRLIVIAPVTARMPAPASLLDSVTGLGALGLQKNLGGEYGERGITANSILYDDTLQEDRLLANIGAACAYLASRQAAYLTGTVMNVDAGRLRSVF